MKIKLYTKDELPNKARIDFTNLLIEQGEVEGDIENKWKRCKTIAIAYENDVAVGIGAIKQKSNSVFGVNKADAIEYQDLREKGTGRRIVEALLNKHKNEVLMATTRESNTKAKALLVSFDFKAKGTT